ncbi:hypothetical protein TH62_21675 [Bacillus sp. TH008]|nr:hypothetical protein TH62_21675 [Bacillus sp. TH008]
MNQPPISFFFKNRRNFAKEEKEYGVFCMWIFIVLLIMLTGFSGTMITILRTMVKQNNRIIELLEEKMKRPDEKRR